MKSRKKTLLWEINSDELAKPSYIFGTMHVKDRRAFESLEVVYDKIEACDAFATEFNLNEVNHNIVENVMDLPIGQTLDLLFKPKTYKKIQKLFKKLTSLDLAFFNNSQPILISNLITERLLSADMPISLDESLWQFATELDKITLGIETYEEQIAVLQKISIDHQITSLRWTVRNFKKFRKDLFKMTALYQQADIQKLHQAARKSVKGLRNILLYDRNVIMADRIANIINEQSIVCAIGAGHLGGKKGVLKLIKQKGYKVKPIMMK